MSPVLTRLSQFCWLFVPCLVFFCLLFVWYFFNSNVIANALVNLWWTSYVSLAIAAMIAWQFGRSRLVYACLLLLLIAGDKELGLTAQLLDIRFSGILLGFIFLLYSKDKGFSALNLFFSLAILLMLFSLCGLALAPLQLASQSWLTTIDSLLFQLSPDIRALIPPFNAVLLITCLLLGLLRLFFRTDNSHNALFFALVLSAFMQIYQVTALTLITLVSLAGLLCYSVLKDSFTMAFKDELTGIPSRRALMQYVQTLGRKYTVVMADIDHFKKFNDTYGHDVGDEVLKLVASKLDKVTGGGKTFRFGGEEFIIVFPRKTTAQVLPFVELVRQTIADYDIALRAKPRPPKPKKRLANNSAKEKIVKVTTSFGVAQRSKEHADFASIMKQADIALYGAKKGGRNCVEAAKQ
ncbi:MAG: GGDEF domain-containing protein [Paraglaciecola sp.]|nr:GGDEF domain-containing protein [Paraglaciecola sp.]